MSPMELQGDHGHGHSFNFLWNNEIGESFNVENSIYYQSKYEEATGNDGCFNVNVNGVKADPDHQEIEKQRGGFQGNNKRKASDNGGSDGEGGKAAGDFDARQIHSPSNERERRKKMADMYNGLYNMLPHLPHRASKVTIIDEAVKQIQKLEDKLQKLEQQKQERLQAAASPKCFVNFPTQAEMADFVAAHNLTIRAAANPSPSSLSAPPYPAAFETITSSNFVMAICDFQAQIIVQSTKVPSPWPFIFSVLMNHRINVIFAHANEVPNCNRCIYLITASAEKGSSPTSFEIFQRAAADLKKLSWIHQERNQVEQPNQLGSQ